MSLTKRISTSHWNLTLCCRPRPQLFHMKKNPQTQPKKRRKNTTNAWLEESQLFCASAKLKLFEEYCYEKKIIVRRANLRSSLSRKKTFAPDGPKLWAGHQTLWLMGCVLQRRGLALIGTRVFKGTVSVAQGPREGPGTPELIYTKDLPVYMKTWTSIKWIKPNNF